jgi:putative RNA 2'-phosphotransferase
VEDRRRTQISKFLSFVLRHEPQAIGLRLDPHGWVEIDVLLNRCLLHGHDISRPVLEEIVATNSKRRFAVSEDGLRIRASQGHTVDVDLGYPPTTPPEFLFHGTAAPRLSSIRTSGLKRMNRHHVHLSPDVATARMVGARRGRPVVLRVFAARMHRDGHLFFLSRNGVWLTTSVPPEYIEIPGLEGGRAW